MKVALVFCAVLVVALAAEYSDRWDNINVDNILGNKRLLEGYVKCLLAADNGKCTSEGKDLKKLLPEALATNCEKCTSIQKEKSEKVIRHLVNKERELWDQLAVKYDPKNEYRVKYQEQAKEKGIEV